MQAYDSGPFGFWPKNDPSEFRRTLFMLLKAYMDESYSETSVFVMAAVFSTGKNWAHFETKWRRLLSRFNRGNLKRLGFPPVSRFHSADLNGSRGEFKRWDDNLRTEFIKLMLSAFVGHDVRRGSYGALALGIPRAAIDKVFPEWSKDDTWRGAAYYIVSQMIVQEYARLDASVRDEVSRTRPGGRLALSKTELIYDRSNYNGSIERGFEMACREPQCSALFSGISRSTWQEAVGLQAADLTAYEVFKEMDRKATGSPRPMRKSLQALGAMKEWTGNAGYIGEEQLKQIRALVEQRRADARPAGANA